MVEPLECPDCGGHVSTAAGLGWRDDDDRVHRWVGTCLHCGVRTGRAPYFGLGPTGTLIPVDGFTVADD